MSRYTFDIETNGLYQQATIVHSLVMIDVDTKSVYSYSDHAGYSPIAEGLQRLNNADEVIGHNIISFDIPVLHKIYKDNFKLKPTCNIFDTLVVSRLIYTDLAVQDAARKGFPKKSSTGRNLHGSHTLEAWGYRLHCYKDTFGATADWDSWSPDMQIYCEQDVAVTLKLYRWLMQKNYSAHAITLEQKFAHILFLQYMSGFPYDFDGGRRLSKDIQAEDTAIIAEIRRISGVQTLNTNSRRQIAEALIARGWKPSEYTDKGTVVVNESVLSGINDDLAQLVVQHFYLLKRQGLIEALQKYYNPETGCIHGEVIGNGCVTGRCSHMRPNVAQIPKVGKDKPLDNRFRALFHPPQGWVEIGCDASALEFRMLAHYAGAYDGGALTNIVLNGDIHTANQEAAGLATRAQAKTFIYAYMYGGGDAKLGSIVMPDATAEQQAKQGGMLRKRFIKRLPALGKLQGDVIKAVRARGYLYGLDRREIKVRREYLALNALLQSAGAVVMKEATVILHDAMVTHGYVYGEDWIQMAHIHDEYQLACRPAIADDVCKIGVEAIRTAGINFNLRCPLDAEAQQGQTWADTH